MMPLLNDPDIETTNKKPLMVGENFNIWELKFGHQNQFRVFYEIDSINFEISILAIGRKIKEKLFIGNKEIKL